MNARLRTALFPIAFVACTGPQAPAMSPRGDLPLATPPPNTARLVFVRPASPCDTFDHAVVVDETGQFVGALTPDTAFAIDVVPGRRAYYAWPGMDMRSERHPGYSPVAVIDTNVAPGEFRGIYVRVVEPPQGRGHCFRWATFHLAASRKSEHEGWLRGLRLMDVDREAGQGYLRSRSELTAGYLAESAALLERQRAAEQRAMESRAPGRE